MLLSDALIPKYSQLVHNGSGFHPNAKRSRCSSPKRFLAFIDRRYSANLAGFVFAPMKI
jgi:hypothetical protein